MNRTLEELVGVRLPRDVGIAGWLSTTLLTGTLLENVDLDGPPQFNGPVYNFVLRLKPGRPRGRRFEVLDQLSPKIGIADEGPVTDVLQYIRDLYEYEHVILTTWDHGSGFSFFTDPDPFMRKKPAKKSVKKSVHPVKQPAVRSKTALRARLNMLGWLKESEPEGLTMIGLQRAIVRSFGRVDVIFMRNCYMQTFDTGMLMRDVADYLVACESTMFFEAYDYTIWLEALLRAGKGQTEKDVAAKALLGFTRDKNVDPAHRMDTAIFALELSYFGAINGAMNRMILELILYASVRGHKPKLMECRRKMVELQKVDWPGADFQLVDAKFWFELAGRLLRYNKKYQEALKDFLELHARMVGGRYFVGSLLSDDKEGYSESGFSVYFPATAVKLGAGGSFYSLYYTPKSPTISPVTRYSLWHEFLGYLLLDIQPAVLL